MRTLQRWLLLSGLAAVAGLSGCVVHDGKPEAEPIWWPAMFIRESTAPAACGYTSPGPGDQAVGTDAAAARTNGGSAAPRS